MKKVLADADFLVAIAKKDDTNHQKALRYATMLKNSAVFVTPFTIPEAVTVLSYKVSHKAAKSFLQSVREQNFIELPLDQMTTKEADSIFLSRNEKGTSWVDCVNVAFVKLYHLDGIVSFDKFYKKTGIVNLL